MDQVSQIREKIDIVSFISEYVPLKKAGRNFKANCPFHGEKTPSFVVSPERQIWHCFGCQKGGSVYDFLMEYERLEFAEALRILAKRAGITLQSTYGQGAASSQKERLYQINSLTKEFYHFVLTKHIAGKRALEYLRQRGITPKIIETFSLGFSPVSGSALVNYLIHKKRYALQDVIDAGLTFQKGSRQVDFFRGRLMFPLQDHRDNVVGFSGRILEQGNIASKYINTRETLIYHKRDHVYGLNNTRDAIRRENQVIIVEGEFDVISCFEHGVSNVVGVKGTALTENQVNLLGRFAQRVTFCFDGDKAGQEAIKRSLSVVEKKGLIPTVIEIPGGKDPDEALRNDQSLFKKAVREDTGIYDYLLTKILAQSDTATAEGKKFVSDQLLPIFAHISNEIIKEHYLKKLSSELDTSYESIAKEMQRLNWQEKVKVIPAAIKIKRNKDEIIEGYLLSVIIQSDIPKLLVEKLWGIIAGVLPRERGYQKIMYLLHEHFSRTDNFDSSAFGNSLPPELTKTYDTCLLFPLPGFDSKEKLTEEVEKTAGKLKVLYIQQKMKMLADQIKQKEKEGQEEEAAELKKNYSDYVTRLNAS